MIQLNSPVIPQLTPLSGLYFVILFCLSFLITYFILENPRKPTQLSRALYFASGAVNVFLYAIIWGMLLVTSNRGLDLTDESFYLMNFLHYEDVSITFSLFGALLKPLYDLSGQSVAVTRQLSIVLLMVLSLVFSMVTIWKFFERSVFERSLENRLPAYHNLINLVLVASAGGALYYWAWLITPSYNWSALSGLMMFWVGLLLWLNYRQAIQSCLGLALLAFSSVIVFWSKLSSTAFLPLYVLGALALNWPHRKQLLSPIAISIAIFCFALGMAFPLVYGDSPGELVQKLQYGIDNRRMLNIDESSINSIILEGVEKSVAYLMDVVAWDNFLLAMLVGSVVLGSIVWRKVNLPRRLGNSIAASSLYSLWALGIYGDSVLSVNETIPTIEVLFQASIVLVAGHIVDFTINSDTGQLFDRKIVHKLLWLVSIFSLVFVYAFGTSNPYSGPAAHAAIFIVICALMLFLVFSNRINNMLLLFMTTTLMLSFIVTLYDAAEEPHRQLSIWDMNQQVALRNGSESLYFEEDAARYFTELQAIANEGGFQADTPIIDLTGHSPGVAYVLNGRAYGVPWIAGGYTDSIEAHIFNLSKWDRDALTQAWILTAEENGHRAVSLDVLSAVNLNFPDDYIKVGEVVRFRTDEVQGLWRPKALSD